MKDEKMRDPLDTPYNEYILEEKNKIRKHALNIGCPKYSVDELMYWVPFMARWEILTVTREMMKSVLKRKENRTFTEFGLNLKCDAIRMKLIIESLTGHCLAEYPNSNFNICNSGCDSYGDIIWKVSKINKNPDFLFKCIRPNGKEKEISVELKYIRQQGGEVNFKKNTDMENLKMILLFGFSHEYFILIEIDGLKYILKRIKPIIKKAWEDKETYRFTLPFNLFEDYEHKELFEEMEKMGYVHKIYIKKKILDGITEKYPYLFLDGKMIFDDQDNFGVKMLREALENHRKYNSEKNGVLSIDKSK